MEIKESGSRCLCNNDNDFLARFCQWVIVQVAFFAVIDHVSREFQIAPTVHIDVKVDFGILRNGICEGKGIICTLGQETCAISAMGVINLEPALQLVNIDWTLISVNIEITCAGDLIYNDGNLIAGGYI